MNKMLTTMFALAVASVTGLYASTAQAQEIKGDAKAGEKKIAMCIGCHGIKGYQASFPEVYKVPMISGQGAGYITAALTAYREGERKHPTMRAIAASLTDQDIADLAAYYSVHGVVQGQAQPANAELSGKAGELLKKGACNSCHGANFNKPIDPSYPKIAGQHADYLFVALKSYKVEKNEKVGRGNAIMGSVAKQFSTAELKEMSKFLSTLPGELKIVPQSEIHQR